jgi:hypothetical protein
MRPAYALVPAAVPVVALIGGLPFANRLEPMVLGMPFLLVWILGWVALTPAFLAASYAIYRRSGGLAGTGAGSSPTPTSGGDR